MANFKENTRYTGGSIAKNRSEQDFLLLREPLELAESDGDIFITVTKELLRRPDLISHNAYGTPDLWWVIYEFNEIRDPLFDLQVNQVLRIPAIDNVIAAINKLER